MRYLIHGQDSAASRERLAQIREELGPFWSSPLSSSDPERGGNYYSQTFLFEKPRAYIFEFFNKDDFKNFNWEALLPELPSEQKTDVFVILWFSFELPVAHKLFQAAKRRDFTELKFDLKTEVFKLADMFFSLDRSSVGRRAFYTKLWHFCRGGEEPIFLVQMVVRKLRTLLWRNFKNVSYRELPPWLRRTVDSSLSLTSDQLLGVYQCLVSLERKLKTSGGEAFSELLVIYERF